MSLESSGGVTYCHSIPALIEGKVVGRDERYVCMLCRASIAEPNCVESVITSAATIFT